MTIFTHRSKALGVLHSLAFALLLTLPGVAFAAVPKTIDVHGGLYAVGGGPVADGSYQMTFSIYPTPFGSAAVFSEGPVAVTVKNGVFQYGLGTKATLSGDTLANLSAPYLAIQVGTDPEFTKLPMTSAPFALRVSTTQALNCSGCVKASHVSADALASYAKTSALAKVATTGAYGDVAGAPDTAAYAKASALAKVATTGAYGDVANAPDLAIYAKAAALAKAATSGAYADITGVPDLTAYAKTAGLAKVATTGAYADLSGAPGLVQLGQACGTGLVIQGIAEDGTIECIETNVDSIPAKNLPLDGLPVVSNNLVTHVTTEIISGKANIAIPDNTPVGVSDTVEVPDMGVATGFTVGLDLVNSDIAKVTVWLYDPNGAEYVLYDKGSFGTTLKTTYPAATEPVKGDLTTWLNKNPKGKWHLKVVDSGFANGTTDGKVNAWSLNFSILSSKNVKVAGNTTVSGSLTAAGKIKVAGKVLGLPGATYRWGVWDTYRYPWDWFMGNDATLFGGINPSSWSDGNAVAWSLNPDKAALASMFYEKGYAKANSLVWAQHWRMGRYNESANARFVGAMFRVKNSTGSNITWPVFFTATSFSSWGDRASVTINGQGIWTGDNCEMGCNTQLNLTVPANRTSTAIFIASSGNPCSRGRFTMLGFYNNSLALPNGLTFVDDLETATGGWEQ